RIRAAGAHVLFLPPYSPDLNPIELLWNKLKELLKSMEARTLQALDDAIARAMDLITCEDIDGWFRHCGYKI
ncbi:transposase, partial [Cystobacter ferrugineus]